MSVVIRREDMKEPQLCSKCIFFQTRTSTYVNKYWEWEEEQEYYCAFTRKVFTENTHSSCPIQEAYTLKI